ncbi:MAG: hypothetical protein JJE37_05200 [Methyloceanibacter sp.]|nr:hypothetical protein [Methyloceanibacter sp.]
MSVFAFPPDKPAPSIAKTALLQATITFAYTLLIVAGVARPNSIAGQLLGQWIGDTYSLTRLLLAEGPEPSSATQFPESVVRWSMTVIHALLGTPFLQPER